MGDLARRHLILTLLLLVLIFGCLGWWIWRKLKGKSLDDTSQAL
jgi:hypothetical protein